MMSTILQRVGVSWGDVSREMIIDALFPGVSQRELAKNLGVKRPPANVPPLNQMNVKQFRDAADPSRVCYQALVNSQIKLLSVENAGLLGDMNILYGDPTGGFKLHLYSKAGSKNAQGVYENTSEMILRELGLEEAERREVQEGKEEVFVSTLKPLYPFLDSDGAPIWRRLNPLLACAFRRVAIGSAGASSSTASRADSAVGSSNRWGAAVQGCVCKTTVSG